MQMTRQQLKDLQKIWYQKLKDSGFKDIESSQKKAFNTPTRHTVFNLKYIQSYYSACENILERDQFENEIARIIWTLHARGMSNRQIMKETKRAMATVNRYITKIKLANNLRLHAGPRKNKK